MAPRRLIRSSPTWRGAEGLRHWFSPSSAFYVNPHSLVSLLPFLVSFSQRAYLSAFRKLDELNRLTAELIDEFAAAGIGTDLARTGNLKAFRERDTAYAEWSGHLKKRGRGAIARAARPSLSGVDWDKRSDEWAGSRPMTPDGLPYIGRVGRSPGCSW